MGGIRNPQNSAKLMMDFSGSFINIQYWKENHSPNVSVGVITEHTETAD